MAIPLRVLILEDRVADADLMAHELRKAGFEPQWQRVETEPGYLAALDQEYDVVLSDYNLPQYDALRALRTLRQRGLDIPFIIVSGTIGEDTAVAAMKEGASDYLITDRRARLGSAVSNALDKKRLHAAERRAIDQLRLQAAAMESAADGIVITDRKGTILYVNPAFPTMTGYTREESLGKTPRILKSGEHSPKFYQDLWKTILTGKVWHGQMTNRRKDGTLYFGLQTITPVHDERGEITHFVAIQQDLTEYKKLEAQFLQAQKMEAFGRLAGGVAHDFNNLLTVICGFSGIIAGLLPANSPARDMLGQVKNAGDQAAGLTRQLLAFSRKQVMQLQVLNLNTELGELKKMLGRLVGEDIELMFQPSPEEYFIKADPTQLQQVIINLAVNARDAMPRGGKLVMATRRANLDEAFTQIHGKAHVGLHVLLEVSDTGSGMTPEVLARIFEPFFTTKEVGKGTGLGLATVIGIVEQSGGFVEVESKPGQGTLFRIYLPRITVSSPGTKASPSSPGLRSGDETILLVEDDDGVRTLAGMILRSAGYTVLEAGDGKNGLEVFTQHTGPIHLLLTDVVMPHLDGCRLGELLAAKEPSPRVLLMSGYLDDAIVRHGIQEKGLPFLQKPFQAAALLGKVRDVLDQPQEAAMKLEPSAVSV